MRCLALFTGGLDAQLAVRLVQAQGVEVVGLYIGTPLCAADGEAAASAASRLGIELSIAQLAAEYCELLRRPRFGRLKAAAACLDCRIAMFAQAVRRRRECQADFVISGEVVGQRPRTATRDLEVVAHHAGLEGLLVRPLSAGLLPSTIPEERGWLDRGRLLALQSKGRKEQHALAKQFSLQPVPPLRSECPLLDDALGERVLDLLREDADVSPADLELAALGRHYCLDGQSRIVVARNRCQSDALARLAECSPQYTLVQPLGFPGPAALIVGQAIIATQVQVAHLIAGQAQGQATAVIRLVATRVGASPETWEIAAAGVEIA